MLYLVLLIKFKGQLIDERDFSCGIFLDFSKAFDTINHEILLKKWSSMAYVGLQISGLAHIFQIVCKQSL